MDDRNWHTGLSEVVKYAVCFDKELFEFLEAHADRILDRDRDIMSYIVEQSIRIKKHIVEEDEKELGVRKLLNFGHTLGHAMESFHEYELYTHGEAVAIGMIYASKLSQKHGGLTQHQVSRITKLIKNLKLPTELPDNIEKYHEFIKKDKKAVGDKVNWILLEDIGKAVSKKLALDELI